MKLYDVADLLSTEEWNSLGFKKISIEERMREKRNIKSKPTGEFRCPKKGEWYLSGAIVTAYKAFNDLTIPFHIAKLVKTKTVTTVVVCEV